MNMLTCWFSFFQGEANPPASFRAPSVVLHGGSVSPITFHSGNNTPVVLRGQA